MSTAEHFLSFAEGEIGYSRWDDPQEGTKYGRWYAEYTGIPWFGTSGVPFCAMGVSYCLVKTNTDCEGFPRAVAIDRRDGFSRMVEPSDLRAGDVIGFDWDNDSTGDHVGIFVRWIDKGWSFETIEFNTGDGEVKRCKRYVTQLTIGVRPYFKASEAPSEQAGRLEVDGAAGTATITAWQEALGTGADGIISDQPEANDRWHRNVWAVEHGEGYSGSELVRAVQWFLSGKGYYIGEDGVDGLWGEYTSKALQTYLKRLGYYGGDIEGDFGYHSVKALQQSINDGRWKA